MTDLMFQDLTVLKQEIYSSCGLCKGTGVLKENLDDQLKYDYIYVPCVCKRVFKYLKELSKAGIPRDYWNLHLSEFDTVPKMFRMFVANYISHIDKAVSRGLGFLMLGDNGIGKTSIMAEVGKHALQLGYTVSYFTLQKYIYSTYSDNESTVDTSAQILLVDELDKAYIKVGSQYVPRTAEELLRTALNNGQIIISATNLTKAELHTMFGKSVLSMLSRRLKYVPMKGEDFSSQKQDLWTKDLLEEYDYFHPNIMRMINFTNDDLGGILDSK